jgi:hypothetical protein
MPVGTGVFAPREGRVLACQDGVPNDEDQPHDADFPGEPSNWILYGYKTTFLRRKRAFLLQHLSPGLKAVVGQKYSKGYRLARSGDSGNTSGPHLHLTLMKGWPTAAQRYDYLANHSLAIYPPSKGWRGLRRHK